MVLVYTMWIQPQKRVERESTWCPVINIGRFVVGPIFRGCTVSLKYGQMIRDRLLNRRSLYLGLQCVACIQDMQFSSPLPGRRSAGSISWVLYSQTGCSPRSDPEDLANLSYAQSLKAALADSDAGPYSLPGGGEQAQQQVILAPLLMAVVLTG